MFEPTNYIQEHFDILHGLIFSIITDEQDIEKRERLKIHLYYLISEYNGIYRELDIPINHNMKIYYENRRIDGSKI